MLGVRITAVPGISCQSRPVRKAEQQIVPLIIHDSDVTGLGLNAGVVIALVVGHFDIIPTCISSGRSGNRQGRRNFLVQRSIVLKPLIGQLAAVYAFRVDR